MALDPWSRDPLFTDEPFCRRAAWLWLRAHVRSKDNCTIRRGQIDVTWRGLGIAWGWHPTTVSRFVASLADRGALTVERVTDSVTGIVTANFRLTLSDETTFEGARTAPVTAVVTAVVTPSEPPPAPVKKGRKENGLEGFDQFYALYPRKVGRGAAERAWRAAVQKVAPETITAGLQRLLPGLMSQEPGFRPHPSTWLNQRRWEDQPEEEHGVRGHHARRPASGQQQLFEAALDLAADLRARGR